MEKLSFKSHFTLAFSLRVVLVIYSNFHDQNFKVPFTDVDYKVFTDAARYMLEGMSPFNRHTYRYSPLLALILTPNIFFYSNFGKLLFSFVDILVAILIRKIVSMNKNDVQIVNSCTYLWLYNPLIIIISTRGNADCLAAFLVILSLYFLECGFCSVAGLVHGISIHFRLYPLVFSLVMYLSLCTSKNRIFINMNQIKFTLTCLASLTIATVTSYYFYGFKFLYESLIYHLIRKDARHNFSVFFYTLYLSAADVVVPSKFLRIFNILPQLILLITLSGFYSYKKNLAFALMTQAFVIVIYNTVMTSQYFFWFMSLFPLCLPKLMYNARRVQILLALWTISQGLWLGMAYALEFRSLNSFNYIWLSSIFFFLINIQVLCDLIQIYEK